LAVLKRSDSRNVVMCTLLRPYLSHFRSPPGYHPHPVYQYGWRASSNGKEAVVVLLVDEGFRVKV